MHKQNIVDTLKNLADAPLRDTAMRLLNTLGYYSDRTGSTGLDAEMWNRFRVAAPDKIRMDDWHAFHLLFQITDTEINRQEMLFESAQLENNLMLSYIFVAVKLGGENWTRTQLADITRFINTQIVQPIMVMFHYGHLLTLAIINRRWDKRENPSGRRGGQTNPREGHVNQGHSSAFTASGASGHPRGTFAREPRPNRRRSQFRYPAQGVGRHSEHRGTQPKILRRVVCVVSMGN